MNRVRRPHRRSGRQVALGAVAALLALGAAGCQGDPPVAGGPTSAVDATRATSSAGGTGPAASTAPTAPGGRTVTVVVGGDILLHGGLTRQAQADAKADPARASNGLDFRPMLAGAKPFVAAADLALCNLETPLAPPGGPYTGYPLFSVPQDILPALKDAGFDACTTASNHAIDKGMEGLTRTLDAMDAAGIAHTGSNRTAAEAQRPLLLDARGVTVAVLAYAYALNGLRPPADKPWAVNLIDVERILAQAKAARAAGAQIVMVALHDGAEYTVAPTESQRRVAAALTASPDVDVVYGHHAHVVQPVDLVNGKWVAYGLGNLLANQHILTKLKVAQHEALVGFTFTETPDGRFVVTRVEARPGAMSNLDEPRRYVDLAALLADPAVPETRKAAYRPVYAAAVRSLTALGADAKGLVVAGR